MSASETIPARAAFPVRLLGLIRDLAIGTLLCLTPLTSVIALGWLTRLMRRTVQDRTGQRAAPVGWLLGARGSGWIARVLGGLAANVRDGVRTAFGLGLLSLPFTLVWLGAWWAGWNNSFHKGYEQAAFGPVAWFAAAFVFLPILAHVPIALAHFAAQDRLAALFDVREIRRIAAAAGWRLPALAVLSVLAAVPIFGARALPVFVEELVPGFTQMTPAEIANVIFIAHLLTAAWSFTALLFVRRQAAIVYAGAVRAGRRPWRLVSWLWLVVASVIWFGLAALIVVGQFMNYDPLHWVTHPLFLLPWPA